MCLHTGYLLKLDQYPPPKFDLGWEFQKFSFECLKELRIGNRVKVWVVRKRCYFKKIVHGQFQAPRF